LDASLAADQLGEVAIAERVGERAASRLVELRSIFGDDLAYVERELESAAADGLAPATKSAAHLLEAGGKRVRPMCVLLSAACFRNDAASESAPRDLAVVAELVHLATLLHDDVIDDADTRRGEIASRRVWGNAVSVLAGDLLLTHALERTARTTAGLDRGETMSELISTLRRLVDGEVIQLRGRVSVSVSESVYFAIVEGKTGSLFSWAARAGARMGGAQPAQIDALGAFGRDVGVAFQLVDDALDYEGDPARTGKKLLGDLREGKVTLPLLVTLAARPDLVRALDRAREGDEAAAADLHAAVVAAHGADVARARAHTYTRSALGALEKLPESRARDLLAALAGELTSRAF
jgi:octaprenyl-diphosphate synthase